MHSILITTLFLVVAPFSTAAPAPLSLTRKDTALTEAQIVQIAPTSENCDNPPAKGECATAHTAAKFASQSFDQYKVTNKAEQAAVLAIMAYESGDFKYNKNHYPGIPGQGTRNMQSAAFNKKYIASIPALRESSARVADDAAALLELLLENETYDFGSGAWFLTTQCTDEVRKALQSGSEAGWQSYITQCVGTSASGDRKAYWDRAVKALGA
ncbi:hypothetical protein N7532_006210 [Penicillium argentinense]|uniref:Uncharacterized protein n=1 Tax=Penicillium argentinense TaxID=1131581 RepID=A0A9W9KAJ3_9EURO|nr:uncharacterized protein N7532_006210 [Penicillium argentinense]KAJ5099209.1 hypothetical protein N7532_006210 [Penicillium argentinense]